MNGRSITYRGIFAVVYTTSISSVYFALGVVARRAAGLTPVVFLVGGAFFFLAALTYIEGSSLHQERGGSSTLARYAFNELASFIAGWAVLLDYVILVAVTALAAANYLGGFWHPLGRDAPQLLIAVGFVLFAAWSNVIGLTARRLAQRLAIASVDLTIQLLVIALGFFLVFHPGRLVDSIDLGSAPTVRDFIFALTIATIAFTGLEAASSLAPEARVSKREFRLLAGPGAALIVLVYVGIALIGVSALPVHHGITDLGQRHLPAPLLGVVGAYHPHWLAETLRYVVAGIATIALTSAANSAMLGISRVGYALATNRQIPSAVGRLHPTRGTPVVVIGVASALAIALVLPTDIDFLVGIFAFGALLAFTIAHVSVIALRFREPTRERPFTIGPSVRIAGASVPIPAVVGALASALAWGSVIWLHSGARYVGLAWMAAGIGLYVVYRRTNEKPLLKRVTIPERALRYEAAEPEFGSILVPIFGGELDDDIVQTAGRLAGEERDELEREGATIEAIWFFEVPMALPLDARLPEPQLNRARDALKRAKAVGEEYEGVEVATAMVRTRRIGEGIVSEARRRGVEAIVLAAEEQSRVRGGALLGGRGGPLDNYVGDVTKYVIRKAPCRVILTAPAAERPRIRHPDERPYEDEDRRPPTATEGA